MKVNNWGCPTCNYVNNPSNMRCALCQTLKIKSLSSPKSLTSKGLLSPKSLNSRERANSTPARSIQAVGAPSSDKANTGRGSAKSNKALRVLGRVRANTEFTGSIKVSRWECSTCHKINNPVNMRCGVCQTSKIPRLSSPKSFNSIVDRSNIQNPKTISKVPTSASKTGKKNKMHVPANWTKESLTDVTYYGKDYSPPCCKIKTILKYYGVPYTTVESKKPGFTSSKIPVLDVNGCRLNGSLIIIKNLARILDGKPMSDEQVRLEKMITFGLAIAMERSVSMSALFCCFAPSIAYWFGPLIGKGKNPKKIFDYSQELKDFLKGKQFFSGFENPGINDLSLYGMIEPFQEAGNAVVNQLLGDIEDPLRIWHNTMKSRVPSLWDKVDSA